MSNAVSQRLDTPVEFVAIEKVGKGYHAQGYKLTARDGRNFFLKKVIADDIGFEYPERKLSSILVGHGMARRAGIAPQPIAVLLETEAGIVTMPEITENAAVYHVQEFESTGGKNYFDLLVERIKKKTLDEKDRREIDRLTDFIVKIHKMKHPSSDERQLKAVYNDGLRAELVHPELIFTFLHSLDETHPLLSPKQQGAYISLLIELIHKWKNRSDRLCALHGDFWGGNAFLRPDDSVWLSDYSRIPWGDPGSDLGHWVSQYMFLYHCTKNPYYREMGEAFLNTYISKTGDEEMRSAISLGFGWPGILYTFSYVIEAIPRARKDAEKDNFENACEIIRKNKFVWIE